MQLASGAQQGDGLFFGQVDVAGIEIDGLVILIVQRTIFIEDVPAVIVSGDFVARHHVLPPAKRTVIQSLFIAICLAAQTVHSDETSFSPAALFISSTRSLGGVQFGDPNPSNITIWAWPIKGYKKVSPLLRSLSVSKPTFVWGSLVIWSNLLIFFGGFTENITETVDMHTTPYLSYKKSFRSFYLPVDSSGQSTPLSSLSSFSQEMRAVLPHASVMRNVFPPKH